MGIFESIKNAIFGSAEASPTATPSDEGAPPVTGAREPAAKEASATKPAPALAVPPAPAAQAPRTVDVAAMLDQAVAMKGQKLDWRHSIVDLMKALDLETSLGARQELAKELNYTGDMSDSATMNIWLHKALMKKLAENGGKVPPELTA